MEQSKRRFDGAPWGLVGRWLCALAIVLAAGNAPALDIVTTFNSGASVYPYPSFDPDSENLKLTALMDDVEIYYQDIFEQAGTLQVEYYYQDLDAEFSTNTLAVCNVTGISGGKVTSCRIRVDSTRTNWFIDSTPLDNSEYDMSQNLYRDLTNPQKTNWFNGTVPDLLEASYYGPANGSETAALNKIDMFTVLLHEMGHGLGMISSTAVDDTGDYDYDFAPELVWGNTMAAECYAHDDRYHLGMTSLMHPYIYVGRRTLPSAVDIFALQDASEWIPGTIDLKRQDFYSASPTADWNTDANWEGNRMPDADDEAYVRHGGIALLSANNAVGSLLVDDGSTVDVGNASLLVIQQTTVGTGSQDATMAISGSTGQLNSAAVVVNEYGTLALSAGAIVNTDTITLSDGATIGMELAGLTPGVDSAWIHVTGSVELDGVLEIDLIDDYLPEVDDTFDLFDFEEGYTGFFDEVIELDGYRFDFSNLGVDGSITFVGEPLVGDANGDGMVDNLDAARLATHWGFNNARWSMGDFDGDGIVGPSDASIMAAHWGSGSAGESAAIPSTEAVPEPSLITMLLAIMLVPLVQRRR
ncbi:MAG: hypothetical protein JW888_13760 [Pirellulales bacterium]|nr:hypothetical protein [Pirellulales bacterium]